MECNIPSAVLEEIALEGLEGITISALWIRLSHRRNFNVALDDMAKNSIWKIICMDDAIEAYILEEPRPPLVIFNRYDHIDTELESICEPDELPEDIYPVAPVEDGVNRGSCSTYYKRVNKTTDVKKLSLDGALSKYEDRLVLVAIQEARSVALGGDRSDIVDSLVITSYIVLERIGRSRDLGEVTQGKHGLSRLNIPPKSAFYYRKRLLEDHFIIKQPISMRINNRNVLGTLLHLPRFYNQRLPKLLVLIKRIVEILKEAPPLYMLDYPTLKARLNTSIMLKKIFATNELKRYVRYDGKVPYRTLFPDAPEKDWKLRNGDNERQVKVIQLLDATVDPDDLFRTEDAPDDASLDGLEEEEAGTGTGILNPAFHQHHQSLIRQAYLCVEAAGPGGLKQKQLAEQLAVNQLDARTLLRALVRLELVDSVVKDQAKNRVYVYIAAVHAHSSDLRTQFEQEQQKIQHLIQSGNRLAESNRSTPDSSAPATPIPAGDQALLSTELEKDVSQMEEAAVDEEGLFRPSISRRILGDEGNTTVADLTYRSLRRANIILEAVREHQVIEEIGVLLRLISSEEAKEGYTSQMDRRSLKRLLVRLANENQIKCIRPVLRCGDKERILNFICQPSITMENSVIRSAIEQAKLKLFCVSKLGLTRYSLKSSQQSDPSAAGFATLPDNLKPGPSLSRSVKEAKEQLRTGQKKLPVKMVHNSNSGRIYGAEPKCVRVREIHGLLFYLIYGYSGMAGLDQAEAKEELKRDNTTLTDETLENIPPIYQAKLGWQMFIPPLPEHCGWPSGWAFLCDILLRLPLSIFVKVVNITYFIEGLTEFLQHPVKQHLLLPHLPLELRQGLIYARKYIFSVHEVITNLVYLGLAQFGPHNLKEKDQVFVYLNRHTSVLDTTTSPPGYHQIARDRQYERKLYAFDTMDDLYGYWFDVWTICSHTPLGCVNTVAGQSITLEVLRKKPAMLDACQPRQPDEAPELDRGQVPGDHLGAAGFDSAFFCHLKRNWTYNKSTVMSNRLELQIKKTGTEGGHLKLGDGQPLAPSAPGRLASLRDNAARFATYTSHSGESLPIPVTVEKNVPHSAKGQKRPKDEASAAKRPSVSWSNLDRRRKRATGSTPATTTRIVKTRKNRIRRRPYYDEADRAALRQMRRLRANWTPVEDSYLLMCKVAGTYLNSSLRYGMIPFFIVRDFVHEKLPESRNKTSRACQRRVNYMMRNPAMVYQVETAVEEIRHDPDVIALSGGGPLSKTERAKLGQEKLEELTIERFRKLMDFLLTRYSQGGTHSAAGTGVQSLALPDTMAEFRRSYALSFAQATLRQRRPLHEVNNAVDIKSSVAYNVIHSSLCTVEDKSSWAFQLFKIYQQYPDTLLRSTLAKMKADMMIAQKKRNLAKKPHAQLPLSACPYKLSITYIHLFLSRYQFDVFHNSHRHLKNLLQQQRQRAREGDWNGVEVGRVHEGGSAAVVTTLMAHRALRFDVHIPDQVIVFDPSIQNQPQQFGGLLERYRLLMNDVAADVADEDHDPNGARKKRRRFGFAPAGSTDVPRLVPFGDASGADAEEAASSSSCRVQNQLLIRTASRIALHMMRDEVLPTGGDKANSSASIPPAHLQDFFVLNACQVFARLERPPASDWIFLSPERKKRIIESIPATLPLSKPSTVQWKELYDREALDDGVKQKATEILQLICRKKELGIPVSELPAAIGRLEDEPCSLEHHMELLLRSGIVIRVGLLTARYVAIEFAQSTWLVRSFKLLRQGREKLEPFNRNTEPARKESAPVADPEKVAEVPEQSRQPAGESREQEKEDEEVNEEVTRKKRKLSGSADEPTAASEEAGTSVEPAEMVGKQRETTSCAEDKAEAAADAGTSRDSAELPRRKRKISCNAQERQHLAKTVDSLGAEDRVDLLVLVKPWIRIDGSLNRRVLDRLLGAVLSHILQKPGGSLLELAERFHPALQPFQVRELLEILEQMGAVQLFSMRRRSKPSLFSPIGICEIVPLDKFAAESNVFCKPRVEALVRLGEFIGEKQYDKDYIPLCTCHSATEA